MAVEPDQQEARQKAPHQLGAHGAQAHQQAGLGQEALERQLELAVYQDVDLLVLGAGHELLLSHDLSRPVIHAPQQFFPFEDADLLLPQMLITGQDPPASDPNGGLQ